MYIYMYNQSETVHVQYKIQSNERHFHLYKKELLKSEMRDVRDSVPVGGDGREAIEEDDNAKQGDWQQPGGVESDPGEIDANFLSEVPPGETKHMYI